MLLKLIKQLNSIFNIGPGQLESIKFFLIYYYYGFLSLLFIGLAASFVLSFKKIVRELSTISRLSWLKLLIILNIALVLRFFVLSHHPQVFYDEVSFIETAENYYSKGLNVYNHWGPVRQDFLICSTGWPFLISLFFRVTGVNINTAFMLAALLSVFTSALVFIVASKLFENEEAGLWSALIFSVFPIYARLSTSSAMGTASVFFVFLSLAAMIFYFRNRCNPLLYFSFFSIAYASNVRQEAVIAILPILTLFFLMFNPHLKKELRNPHFYIGFILLAVFSIPPALASFYGVSTGFYYFYESPEEMHKHIISNLKYNVTYWLVNEIHPFVITILAVAGGWAAWKRWRKLLLYLGAWFLALHVFYSLNPSCDFSLKFTIDSWRTAAHPTIPMIILAGPGLVLINEYFKKNYPKFAPVIAGLLIISILLIPARFYDFMNNKTFVAKEYLFVRHVTSQMPENSEIIIDSPGLSPYLWESYSSIFNYNSPVPGRHYNEFTPSSFTSGRRMLGDVIRWKNSGKRVFLYLYGVSEPERWENFRWFDHFFELRKVSEMEVKIVNAKYVFYEIVRVRNFQLNSNIMGTEGNNE